MSFWKDGLWLISLYKRDDEIGALEKELGRKHRLLSWLIGPIAGIALAWLTYTYQGDLKQGFVLFTQILLFISFLVTRTYRENQWVYLLYIGLLYLL